MELNTDRELQKVESPLLSEGDSAGCAPDSESSRAGGAHVEEVPLQRVKSVKITAGGAIDRIEFVYADGKKWSLGGPHGSKGIPPLVLADDEYLVEIRHEALPQWWYVGASIELRTNKGRKFRHVAGWGSGEENSMVVFRAQPGNCILSLKLHEGALEGIIEGPCHVPGDENLILYMVYWLRLRATSDGDGGLLEVKCSKGHAMREDWSRVGHICDECSRRGTMARCSGGCDYDLCETCYRHHAEGWASSVQRRGFESRDSALLFASRHGAGPPAQVALGPLRMELDDHPWFDALGELSGVLRACLHRILRLRSRSASNTAAAEVRIRGAHRGGFVDEVMEGGLGPPNASGLALQGYPMAGGSGREAHTPIRPGTTRAVEDEENTNFAGLVVDVQGGTRVRAWGPKARLAMCEKAACDAGEFSPAAWEKRSSSLAGWVAWVRNMGPMLWRVLTLLNWREEVSASAAIGFCIILRSVFDGWQPVLTGAVFNLINGDQHEVERESHFLHVLCSWTFGCSGRLPLARSIIFGLMFAALLQGLAKAFGEGVKLAMRRRQEGKMRIEMFEHLLAQDQALYDTLRRGDLVNKAQLSAMNQVTEWLWGIMSDAVKLATQLVFLFAISPAMTIIYVVLLPALEQLTRRYLESSLRAQDRREAGLDFIRVQVINEAVGMIRTVKTFSREDRHVGLVAIAAAGGAAAACGAAGNGSTALPGWRATFPGRRIRHGAVTVFNDVSARAVYCFCLWCGLVWMERDFSAGDMTAYLLLIQQVGGLAERLRNQFRELSRRHDVLQDHFEFMDRAPGVLPGDHCGEVVGHIEFKDVEFRYPARPDSLVLKGVSFDMASGQMTALVGASGSGKSTIAALLFRHYDPSAGDVLVDGISLRAWNTEHLHIHMSLVAQQPLLFDTSIRNNLTYGCRRAVSDAEIEEAARMANAHDFVVNLPAGYETYVGDQGAHMSGGQKQRLSIARAVILKPRILCLDEATSALDAEAEGVVQDALDVAMRGCTTLVIAHRLSTIKFAHQIVCLRDGHIVEQGPPRELLAKQGYYYSLVRRQVCTLDDLDGFNLQIDQEPSASALGSTPLAGLPEAACPDGVTVEAQPVTSEGTAD